MKRVVFILLGISLTAAMAVGQTVQQRQGINLSGVKYIDSTGIGELIANYTTVSRQGGQLKLLNLTDRVQNLLVITKLLTVFDSYDNEAEALKSFQ